MPVAEVMQESRAQNSSQACCPTNATEPAAAKGCCGTALADESPDQLSAVDFPNNSRIHISLNVKNLKHSLWFYRLLFNQTPTKLRDDYAKFEPTVPSVNFTINQHEDAIDRDGHFGIEVKSVEAVHAIAERLTAGGLTVDTRETQVACCYSVQDKAWVVDPDGNHWEVFVVTNNEAEEGCGLSCICYDSETGGCNWKARQ